MIKKNSVPRNAPGNDCTWPLFSKNKRKEMNKRPGPNYSQTVVDCWLHWRESQSSMHTGTLLCQSTISGWLLYNGRSCTVHIHICTVVYCMIQIAMLLLMRSDHTYMNCDIAGPMDVQVAYIKVVHYIYWSQLALGHMSRTIKQVWCIYTQMKMRWRATWFWKHMLAAADGSS